MSTSYGVRLWLTCPACGLDTPLWREVEAVECAHCGEHVSLASGWLQEELKMFATEVAPGLPPGVPQTLTIGDRRQCRAELIVEAPACPACHVILPPIDGEQVTGRIYCPSCGAAISARTANERLSGSIAAILGEEVGEPAPTASDQPVILRCMWCANRLCVDGSHRTITCDHCATPNIVPSTIWHRLHPEAMPPRWYVLRR